MSAAISRLPVIQVHCTCRINLPSVPRAGSVRRVTPSLSWKLSPRHQISRGPSRSVNAAMARSEEHTSELQSLMRISYAVFCLKKKKIKNINTPIHTTQTQTLTPSTTTHHDSTH